MLSFWVFHEDHFPCNLTLFCLLMLYSSPSAGPFVLPMFPVAHVSFKFQPLFQPLFHPWTPLATIPSSCFVICLAPIVFLFLLRFMNVNCFMSCSTASFSVTCHSHILLLPTITSSQARIWIEMPQVLTSHQYILLGSDFMTFLLDSRPVDGSPALCCPAWRDHGA